MIIAYLSTRYNSSLLGNVIKGKRDLNNILSDFNSLDADPKELYRVFKYASTPLNDNDIPLLNLY